MKTKQIVTFSLLALVVGSLAWTIAGAMRAPAPAEPPTDAAPSPEAAAAEPELIVYYFHGNTRCATCRKIEAQAGEALTADLAAELAAGRVQWLPVNIDEPGNEHFVQDYQLHTRSVVLVRPDGAAPYRNLEEIWSLVGSPDAYRAYITANAREMLEAGS